MFTISCELSSHYKRAPTFDCNIKLELINTRIISFVYPIIDATDRPNIIKKEHIANGSFAQSA